VAIEGLPEGVTCETMHSEKDGDSAKEVTLKIIGSEAAAAFSDPIRIVCTPEESKPAVTAVSPIQNSTTTTSSVWLTVIAASAEENASTEQNGDAAAKE